MSPHDPKGKSAPDASARLLRLIADKAPVLLAYCDADSRFKFVNRPYADRFSEPVRSWVAGEVRSRAEGSEWSGEYEDYRKDGSRYEKAPLPYTNYPGMSETEGLTAVARGLRSGEGLWIVRFEDWLWDGRDLTTQFLTNRGARRTLLRTFDGVTVTRWEVP